MNPIIKIVVLALTIILSNCLYAQNLDSLYRVYKNTSNPSAQIKAGVSIAEQIYGTDYNKTLEIMLKVKQLSEKHNNLYGLTESNAWLGYLYEHVGKLDSAIIFYKKSAEQYKNQKKLEDLATVYNNISSVYISLSKNDSSIYYAVEALKIFESLNNFSGVSFTSNNIGKIYTEIKLYQKAETFFYKSLFAAKKQKDQTVLGYAYVNLASLKTQIREYDTSLVLYKNALECFEKTKEAYGLTLTLENYANLLSQNKKHQLAFQLYLRSYEIKIKMNDVQGLADLCRDLALVSIELSNFEKANTYHLESLKYAELCNKPESILRNLNAYSHTKALKGDYKNAFELIQRAFVLKDSIYKYSLPKQIQEIESKYQSEKKDLEIKNLKEKNELESIAKNAEQKARYLQLFGFTTVFILLIILLLFIWLNFKKQQKATLLINEQKNIIEEKNKIVEHQHKELTDSINYAQRIQRSFFASKQLLDKNLKSYFIYYQPKDIVSGDFYWAEMVDDKLYFVTADCTGHGIPGAFMSLLNISLLNEALHSRKINSPSGFLNFVRSVLIKGLLPDKTGSGGNDGMDAVFTSIDFKNKKLDYAAANNPIWLFRKTGNDYNVSELKADKMPVGRSPMQDNLFNQYTHDLYSNDWIITFTDGFADQFGGTKGKKLKYKPMQELLLKAVSNSSDIESELRSFFNDWKGDHEQIDDVLVVGIKID